jgi:hypothetical protein
MYYKGGKETTSTCAKVPEGTVGKIRKDLYKHIHQGTAQAGESTEQNKGK